VNSKKISDAKFVSRNISGRVAVTKIPEIIKSVGFVSGAQLCHEHEMSTTINTFFIAEKEWPEKA
jgi:hypothetical protein